MYELRRILVPTDFSHHADDAMEHAVFMGSRYEAEIVALHVDEFIVSPLGASDVSDPAIVAYQERKRQYLEQQFGRICEAVKEHPVRVQTLVIPGRAYKVIVEEAEKKEYDLVVIATRGLTHLSPYLMGSTAERVVRLSRQPVLSLQSAPKHGGAISSVLCPTDFSPAGNVALSYALSIARRYRALLYIQYVSELEHPEKEADIRKRIPPMEEHHPLAQEVKIEYVFDRDVEPSNSIIRFADDREIDLIVMSTHGRRGLRRVHIGNTTAEVVRQSTRPVLTITHPFHKKIFTAPVTQARVSPLSGRR